MIDGKVTFKPGTMLNPVPAVMVSCGANPTDHNIITIGWTGILCSDPAITYVSVRKHRHSHGILMKDKEFVINLTTKDLVKITDFCGVKSGRDFDKFAHNNLTKIYGDYVKSPMIKECPVNLECKVIEVKELGTHDMFMAEILAVHVSENLMDENNKLALDKARLLAYSHGEYFALPPENIGTFGFSIMKPKTKKRKGIK